VVLRLALGQISFSVVENTFATRQLAVLATRIVFQDILAQVCAEIKILRQFLDEKVTYSMALGFSTFEIFFLLLFVLCFSFCCSDWPSTGLAWG